MTGYHEIAAELRDAIHRGDYPPGATLPRVVDLAAQYDVTETTAQRAITVLRTEGLVAQTRRRGTVVRDRTPLRLNIARCTDATAHAGPWKVACAAQGLEGWTEVTGVEEHPPEETVARELGLDPGATVIRRGNRMTTSGRVAQLQETWLPASLFAGTLLAAPDKVTGGIYRTSVMVDLNFSTIFPTGAGSCPARAPSTCWLTADHHPVALLPGPPPPGRPVPDHGSGRVPGGRV